MKKLWYWVAGGIILLLAILAGNKVGRYRKRARKANDAADAFDAAEGEAAIAEARVAHAKAKEAQARAGTARAVATRRIQQLKGKDENMAAIAERFNKRVRNR